MCKICKIGFITICLTFGYKENFVIWLLPLEMENINNISLFEEYGILLLKYLSHFNCVVKETYIFTLLSALQNVNV